jgi:hypothetical protein
VAGVKVARPAGIVSGTAPGRSRWAREATGTVTTKVRQRFRGGGMGRGNPSRSSVPSGRRGPEREDVRIVRTAPVASCASQR